MVANFRPRGSPPREWRLAGATRPADRRSDAPRLWSEPRRHSAGSLSGEIVSIDRFGNLISNIPAAWVAAGRWRCRIGGHAAPLLSTYADVSSGALVGLIGSDGSVEIAVRNGNAAQQLGVGIGTLIELWTTE